MLNFLFALLHFVLQLLKLSRHRVLGPFFLQAVSFLCQSLFMDMSLSKSLYFNLKAFFLKNLVLHALLEVKYLLVVALLFDTLLLIQLTKLDLHLDKIFALSFLAFVQVECKLISSLAVMVILFAELTFNSCLLVKRYMKFADFLLEAINSLSIHVFQPYHLLRLVLQLGLKALANLFFYSLNILERRDFVRFLVLSLTSKSLL